MTIDSVGKDHNSSTNIQNELIVFDFDETIIDCNSDDHINMLAPNKQIPKTLWSQEYNRNWPNYMQQVFNYLHKNGVQKQDYQQCMTSIPFVPGMKELLENLSKGTNEKHFESIIISDANEFFIDEILKHFQLKHCFREIFTNRAHFDEQGCLQVKDYHHQNWCTISGENLCKGHVLKEYIKKRESTNSVDQQPIQFDRICYVGDGSNDLCPALRLSEKDLVFARHGYRLHRLCKEKESELKAKVIPFLNGHDIWRALIQ